MHSVIIVISIIFQHASNSVCMLFVHIIEALLALSLLIMIHIEIKLYWSEDYLL